MNRCNTRFVIERIDADPTSHAAAVTAVRESGGSDRAAGEAIRVALEGRAGLTPGGVLSLLGGGLRVDWTAVGWYFREQGQLPARAPVPDTAGAAERARQEHARYKAALECIAATDRGQPGEVAARALAWTYIRGAL